MNVKLTAGEGDFPIPDKKRIIFEIEKSFPDPVTIEIEGGKTYTTVPFSTLLLKKMNAIKKLVEDGILENEEGEAQTFALLFDVEIKEAETLDLRIIGRILKNVFQVMKESGKFILGDIKENQGIMETPKFFIIERQKNKDN